VTATAAFDVVSLAQRLRRCGLSVGVGSTLTFAEALEVLDPPDHDDVYWAGRATLVHRPEDIATFDREFRSWWSATGGDAGGPPATSGPQPVSVSLDDGDDFDDEGTAPDQPGDEPDVVVRWSSHEILRHKDFAGCTTAELDEARRLMADLRFRGAVRRSRRRRPSRHRGPDRHLDLWRTVRHALSTEGEIVRRRYSAPATTPRRLVLIVDISASMEPYARALVRFAQAAVAGRAKVEVFVFGTSLTRLTRELAARDPDLALARAAAVIQDWAGGTRLGECLQTFNDRWGVRGTARGAIVTILSDGWDRGDADLLAEQMARLHRVAHRIVWVNPLKATDGYEPLAKGMAAALPFVDRFVEGHNLDALDQLIEVISSYDESGRSAMRNRR
jgi:uncharacterized protein with von Willebrand factor type A (vWA) domain